MGRPPTLPKQFRDGFYIEVCNKGSKTGTKIIRRTYEEMLDSIKEYSRTKTVIVLGESRKGKWVDKPHVHE